MSSGFTPRMIARTGPHIREIATEIVDAVAKRGECDFVTEIAAELPLQVIAEFIGIPQEDRHKIFTWSNTMIGLDDPEYANSSIEKATEAAAEMFGYADALATERRKTRARTSHEADPGGGRRRAAHATWSSTPSSCCCRGRQRDDAQPHLGRHAGSDREPGRAAEADRRSVAARPASRRCCAG